MSLQQVVHQTRAHPFVVHLLDHIEQRLFYAPLPSPTDWGKSCRGATSGSATRPGRGDVVSFRPHDIRRLSHMFLTLDVLEIDRSRWRAVFQTLNEAIGLASSDQRREQLGAPPQADISRDAVLRDDIHPDCRSRVARRTSTRMSVAPASRLFSISSLTADAGRSTTSPAAIWLATSGARMWMGMAGLYHRGDGDRTSQRVRCEPNAAS
jgi:hypothetical protein